MAPIRVLVLLVIPLIGIFLQKSSSKSIDESVINNVESSSNLEEDHELIRTKRDVDSTFAEDMLESERAVGDSALSDGDETQEIEKRGRRRRRSGRRRSGRRRSRSRRSGRRRSGRRRSGRRRSGRRRSGQKRPGQRGPRRGGSRRGGSSGGRGSALGTLDAINSGLGAMDAGLGLAQTLADRNRGNGDGDEDEDGDGDDY